jgi:3-oxoacyl-[acyl-carrier-protein] synthase II
MDWAISGTGLVSSVGDNCQACFAAFCAGITGNKPLQAFDPERFNVRRAYEIADRAPGCDRTGRATEWLCRAVAEALAMAGLADDRDTRLAVLVGTGLRELRSLELWWADGQPLDVAELHFGGALRERIGLAGPVVTLSNACSASSFALGLAADLLELDEADAVLVAGSDSITESMFGLADRANPLRPARVQPFDRDRRGVLLGEGAAALILEPASRARARGIPPLAWLRGVGMSCDAFHETAPDCQGVVRAMRDAHERAGVSIDQVDLLMAHGTGTALNDQNELRAFKTVFGRRAGCVPISAIKSMTGHTSGASALFGVITAVESMRHCRIPPTVGFDGPMPEAEDLDIVAGSARTSPVRMAQVDAFGFGGVNAVAIIGTTSS